MRYLQECIIVSLLCTAFFQPLQAQKTAGIFYFTMLIDNEIVTLDKKERKQEGFFAGESLSIDIPEDIVDSLKRITERALSAKLKADVQCVYATTKNGKTFDTNGVEGSTEKMSVEGLPFATFKKASEQFKKDLYLQIQVSIEDGKGVSLDIGSRYHKIKPMISMKVKAFNGDKKEVWQHDAELKNMAKLKRWKDDDDYWEHRGGQTLSAEMILAMYTLMIDEFAR